MSDETNEPEPPQPRTAIALRYDSGRDLSPVVIATGRNHVADAILAAAKRHKVPIREDRALAALLADLDLGSYIPPEMYRAVAEVLAWVYRVENGRRG